MTLPRSGQLSVQHIEGLRFRATVGEHIVEMDGAPEDGGTGAAPSAPQLFAAALAACICEFVANSCRLHDIPCERLSVDVTFEELAGPRRLGSFAATLHIEPQPSEEVRRRLLGVARHATLVNTLAHPPDVVVRFVSEQEA